MPAARNGVEEQDWWKVGVSGGVRRGVVRVGEWDTKGAGLAAVPQEEQLYSSTNSSRLGH